MASETSELTFVRCPSCRSLVPASAARCRICNNPLEGTNRAEGGDATRPPGRVRQKTITASAEELLQGTGFGDDASSTQPAATTPFDGPPVGGNGDHEVVDPLADFLQEFEEGAPAITAPPLSQEIPEGVAANDDDDDELDSFLDEFDTYAATPEPVEEPMAPPMAPPPVQAPPIVEPVQELSPLPVAQPVAEVDPLDLDGDPLEAFMTDADDDFDIAPIAEPTREFAQPARQPEPEPQYQAPPVKPARQEPPRQEARRQEPPRQEPPRQEQRSAERPQQAPRQAPPPPPQEQKQARPPQDERGRNGRDGRHGGGNHGDNRRERPKHERRSEENRRDEHQHRGRHEERRHEDRRNQERRSAPEQERSQAPVAGPKTMKMRPGRLFGWLVSYESPDGRSIELREGKFFITGSSIRGTDLVIEDPSISTPHALMSVSSEHGLLLQDLMSERGVFVRSGERGQYKREDGVVELKHGEWVRFGDVEFLLTVVPGGGEVASAKFMKAIVTLTLCCTMTLLAGCGRSPVADDLAQREANKIVAILGEHGIEATTEKGRGSKGRYSVLVSEREFGSAVALLTKFNLPVERGASFEDLMAPSGILPASADVENLRMDRAVAAEVEQLLLGLDGVSAASVVVRSHSVGYGGSASVSIVAQTEDGTLDQGKARELVTRAVPGVKDSDISFVLSRQPGGSCAGLGGSSEPLVPFLSYWRVPVSEYNSLAYLLIAVMSVVALLTGIGGYIYGQYEAAKTADSSPPQKARGEQPRVTTGVTRVNDDDEEEGV